MRKQLVKHDVDLANLPPLTDAQKAELVGLGAEPDSDIDCSDIPPLTEDFWKNAVVGRF